MWVSSRRASASAAVAGVAVVAVVAGTLPVASGKNTRSARKRRVPEIFPVAAKPTVHVPTRPLRDFLRAANSFDSELPVARRRKTTDRSK